jgi:hypothetical protein
MNVNVFYHIYSIDGVQSIIDEQIDKLIKHKDFNFFINIDISSGYNLPNDTLDKIKSLTTNITYTSEKRHEMSTLSAMYKHALENDAYYLYIHTKGSSRVNGVNNDPPFPYENVENWRRIMEHFCIENSETCISELQNYDLVGCNYISLVTIPDIWQERGVGSHYSGNFWWSKSEFIKKLPNLDLISNSNRFLAEFWIGMINHKALCLYPSLTTTNNNRGYHYTPESEYKNKIIKTKFMNNKEMEFVPQSRSTPKLATQEPSAWGDIPSILEDIIKRFNIKCDKAIEFGVEWGYSTSALSNYFSDVIGVDTFEGDEHAGFKGDIFEKTKGYLSEFTNIKLVKSSYQDYVVDNNDSFNLAHVDIIHTYEETFKCGEWCVNHSDVVIFHDTESFPEVKRACGDLAIKYNLDFHNYMGSNGLGILVKKS